MRGQAGGPAPDRPVYGISVAAELAGVEPRSLRHYENRGLMAPARTAGGTRRYSDTTSRVVNGSAPCSLPGSTWRGLPWCWTWKVSSTCCVRYWPGFVATTPEIDLGPESGERAPEGGQRRGGGNST